LLLSATTPSMDHTWDFYCKNTNIFSFRKGFGEKKRIIGIKRQSLKLKTDISSAKIGDFYQKKAVLD
jgi:hypothetical protein